MKQRPEASTPVMGITDDGNCGGRFHRRGHAEPHVPMAGSDDVGLTPLGTALLDLLRDDPRFRAIIDDPFGDHAGEPR
jgi:hypothetical protein